MIKKKYKLLITLETLGNPESDRLENFTGAHDKSKNKAK